MIDILIKRRYKGSMSYPNDYVMQKISITPKERDKAKILAKQKGMTLQGFVGQLIKRELKASEAADGNPQ